MIDAVMIGFDIFTWKLLFRNNIRVVKAFEAEEALEAITGWRKVGSVYQFEDFNIELVKEKSVLPHYFSRETRYRETDLLLGNAVIDKSVFVGEEVYTWPGAIVAPYCVLEGDIEILEGAYIESGTIIGLGARIRSGAHVGRSVIGSGVVVHPGVRISNGSTVPDGEVVAPGGPYDYDFIRRKTTSPS